MDTDASSEKDLPNKKTFLPSLARQESPDSARDPMRVLKEIAADPNIDDETKAWLFNFAVTRFNNRRRMAYLALIALLVFLAFLVFGAIYDGSISECVKGQDDKITCNAGILGSIKEIEGLLEWVCGFLTSIVATYYGVSSFRPSS